MKAIKLLLASLCCILIPLTSCTQNKKTTSMEQTDNKAVVCYFSATGTTEAAAKRLAKIANADIIEITPEVLYTAADLDWTDSLSRSSVEMHNRTMRPALKNPSTDLSSYSVVYIGYPNWWNTHPTIINTFIEANDLTGKTIVPFMTSGGSDIVNSEKELKEQYPTLKFGKGLLMNSKTDTEIQDWAEQYK